MQIMIYEHRILIGCRCLQAFISALMSWHLRNANYDLHASESDRMPMLPKLAFISALMSWHLRNANYDLHASEIDPEILQKLAFISALILLNFIID
jgi:hypothetical protein